MPENIICTFHDVTERDVDLLCLEAFSSLQSFTDLFLAKIGLLGACVHQVEHSKTDPELGESDMTVIVTKDSTHYGILVENKIDAIAQPRQCERYFERGKLGVRNGDYSEFFVFLLAPEKYLKDNASAKEYPFHMTYEELIAFFETNKDAYKAAALKQAIHTQKAGYQVKENKAVTTFWDAYIAYQRKHYPHLPLISSAGPKGASATWPQYKVNGFDIVHKSEKECVDLTFWGGAKKITLLKNILTKELGDLKHLGVQLVTAGKSAVLRMYVPYLDFKLPFASYSDTIPTVFEGIAKMGELAYLLDAQTMESLIKGDLEYEMD